MTREELQQFIYSEAYKVSRGNGFYDFDLSNQNTRTARKSVEGICEQYLIGEVLFEEVESIVRFWLAVVYNETKLAWFRKWNQWTKSPVEIEDNNEVISTRELEFLNERYAKWLGADKTWTDFIPQQVVTQEDLQEWKYQLSVYVPKKRRKVYTRKQRQMDEVKKWRQTQNARKINRKAK